MNWYLEQKHAWDWRAMLPKGKPAPLVPTQHSKALQAPTRDRRVVENELQQIQMQINMFRGPQKNSPNAAQKLQELQAKFQELLTESSQLHEQGMQTSGK